MLDVIALTVDSVSLAIAAACYLGVARILGQRAVDGPLSIGHSAFRLWWSALALAMAAGSVTYTFILLDVGVMPIYQALLETFVLANAVASGAILTHALFVLTGRPAVARLGWAAGAASAFFYTAVLFWATEGVTSLNVDGAGGGPEMSTATLFALLLGFFAPHLIGALTYLALLPQATEPSLRYRTVFIACSILLSSLSWLGFAFVWTEVAGPQLSIMLHVVALASPVAVLLAYRPPEGLQRRLGVQPLVASGGVLQR